MSKSAEVQIPQVDRVKNRLSDAQAIMDAKFAEERGRVQGEMVVGFLSPEITREGSGMIAAMGTRNPVRYDDIAARTTRLPASFHEATTVVPPDEIQRAGGRLGRIAHNSVAEVVTLGKSSEGGDRALAVEGISAAALLNGVARLRYGGLEIFSSRAGVLTNRELPSTPCSKPFGGSQKFFQFFHQLLLLG